MPMRILIENGSYDMVNQGDVAMLQVAVARLSRLWPQAVIEVITSAPEQLARHCPPARPLDASGRLSWHKSRRLFGPLHRISPRPIARGMTRLENIIWQRWPALGRRYVRLTRTARPDLDPKRMDSFLNALFKADLVVASGGGYITDAFRGHATKVLDTLATAARLGKPTATFSQGLGPIQHPGLLAKARAVFPKIDLIALREGRTGPALLTSFGVDPGRVVITGDDALTLAYEARVPQLSLGIGVGWRTSAYSELTQDLIELVGPALREAAGKHEAPLIPLPISSYDYESDASAIQRLLGGTDGNGPARGQGLDSPKKIIQQVHHCRLVVAGSYHAAVFALGQGVPVVCLARSDYYRDKFMGLGTQFGAGCQVILLDDGPVKDRLLAGIEHAWQSAERLRSHLLARTIEQIELGQSVYQRLFELVTSHAGK